MGGEEKGGERRGVNIAIRSYNKLIVLEMVVHVRTCIPVCRSWLPVCLS